jgi:predicted enzyme involved in methoxymalonyl-ACP biosynthesis
MISVIVCRQQPFKVWTIDSWLMSCRVLGRGVERMVLREIIHHGKFKGIERLIGVYRPTSRNQMVRDHYKGLGFTRINTTSDAEVVWELLTSAEVEGAPMRVRRVGFADEVKV